MAKFRRDAFAAKDTFGKKPFFTEQPETPVKGKKGPKAEKKEVKTAKSTDRFELWAYDEYGQGNIIMSSGDLEAIISRARKYTTEANCDNALASGERDKNWETYFPMIFKGDEIDTNTLYAGNKLNGRHYVFTKSGGSWKSIPMPAGTEVRFFLGDVNNGRKAEVWFLKNVKGKVITSLSDQSLEHKTELFVKIISKNA